jgi:hypothetical protein
MWSRYHIVGVLYHTLTTQPASSLITAVAACGFSKCFGKLAGGQVEGRNRVTNYCRRFVIGHANSALSGPVPGNIIHVFL